MKQRVKADVSRAWIKKELFWRVKVLSMRNS